MAQIIPIRDLKNTAEISAKCAASSEPIFITKNGYGDMVIMNMDVYNRTVAKLHLYGELKKAEDELASGIAASSAEDFMREIKGKYEKLSR
ncbi:MAG: type II toxin-antitoxin system Phd/YefM family antitoxin [Clostridiales bacterium]|nr:type II toxin-antitoxin system Phd/YefM family antitoxin [Clostridiales bacterium]